MSTQSQPSAPWPRLPLRRILCGTDFSPLAEQAVQRAAQLAREHGATLLLAHVVPSSLWDDATTRLRDMLGADSPTPESLTAEAHARLVEQCCRLELAGAGACDVAVAYGRPPTELARQTTELEADLLVVADRGSHSLRDVTLGTTAQKLLRTSPRPVLVVKRAPVSAYAAVLAPTDFSEPSRAAIRAAAALFPQSVLHLAHAYELPFDGVLRADIEPATRRYYDEQARRRLGADLFALADELGIAASRRVLHVEHGYPATCIEQWIATTRADLVVLAAHGKSALERAFLGSVSLHTLGNAPCDVLLLRGIE